jgi:hypothetical protein
MQNFTFTPSEEMESGIKVPFLEEARSSFAPYYDQRDKNDLKVKEQIYAEMAKLSAGNIIFQEGHFGDTPKRHGYIVRFTLGGLPARMLVAGLPIRDGVTPLKILRVRLQALYVMRDWLKAAVTSQVFSPGNHPLIQFLLVDGQRTLAQVVIEDRHLPNTNPVLMSGNGNHS